MESCIFRENKVTDDEASGTNLPRFYPCVRSRSTRLQDSWADFFFYVLVPGRIVRYRPVAAALGVSVLEVTMVGDLGSYHHMAWYAGELIFRPFHQGSICFLHRVQQQRVECFDELGRTDHDAQEHCFDPRFPIYHGSNV